MIPAIEPVDPNGVADEVREVMARSEFRYDPSIAERAMEWISRQLERLFGNRGPSGASIGATGIGSVVAWLIIALAAAAVVAAIVYVVVHRVRSPHTDEEPVLATEVEHRHPADHWTRLAEEHESRGEWKEALRCRYRALVRTLTDRRRVPDVVGLTTGELRLELHETTPRAEEAFDRATSLFESAWYAGRPTGPDENGAVRAAAAEVLAQLDARVPA